MQAVSKQDPSKEAGHKLEGADCLAIMALKKAWAKSPGYWVGIYRRIKGSSDFYWIHCRWAFLKKAGDLVAGDMVSRPYTSLAAVAQAFAAHYVRLTVEREYEQALPVEFSIADLEDLIVVAVSHIMPAKSTSIQIDITDSRFKEDQKEREKNTKW